VDHHPVTDADLVDLAVTLTGVERYRYLCSPANRHPPPYSAADYLRLVRSIATGEPMELGPALNSSQWSVVSNQKDDLTPAPDQLRWRCCP
jgi:hypothetical protein